MKATRVERHIITKTHPMWKDCDSLCFKSKNLYNYALYIQRQLFIGKKPILKYNELTFELKHSEPFKALGSNSSQHTLKLLDKCWKSFFVAIKDYMKHPNKYLGKPRLPNYKEKDGRHICVLTNLQSQIKEGYLYFAFRTLKEYNNLFKTNVKNKHMQTRIVPKGSCYMLEIVYEKEIIESSIEPNRICGIDLGVNNFATLTNNVGALSIVINGRVLKSYNQYWNKKLAISRSDLMKRHKMHWSNELERLTQQRNNKMEYFMHCASKSVVNYCIGLNIDTVVIGHNKKWKQDCRLNKNINQGFVQIPFNNFIEKLKYKCEDVGIKFIQTEESYTSGTSFLDNELPIKSNYNKKRRIHRGMFKSNDGKLINSDVNGSLQIIKKVFPNVFNDGIVGVYLHPIRVSIS